MNWTKVRKSIDKIFGIDRKDVKAQLNDIYRDIRSLRDQVNITITGKDVIEIIEIIMPEIKVKLEKLEKQLKNLL